MLWFILGLIIGGMCGYWLGKRLNPVVIYNDPGKTNLIHNIITDTKHIKGDS